MHSVGCCRVALPKGCVGLHHLVADASHVAFVGGELLVYTLRVKLDVEQKRPDLVRATADGLDHRFFRLPSLLFALSCSVPLLLFELSRSFSPLLREVRGLLCIIDLPGNAAGNDDADGDAKEDLGWVLGEPGSPNLSRRRMQRYCIDPRRAARNG